ncbi:MAG: tetratricopeptide repeat protein [Candidatus Aminicenantales bacterium]
MKKTILITLCVLLIAGSLSAQNWKGKGRLEGIILDEKGTPVPGVKVKFTFVKDNEGFEVVSEQTGKFYGNWIRKGTWNIDFFKPGFEVKAISINANEYTKNEDLKIILIKAAGIVLTQEIKDKLNAANLLFDQKNYPAAIEAYTGIITENPEIYILYKNIGNCYFAQEQYEKAEETYMKILEKEADNADAMVLIGNTYANRNMGDKAMEWYAKINLEKITDATVLVNIGINYLNMGKADEALKYFKQAVVVNPNDLDALYRLGLAYISSTDSSDAIVCFENYLKIDSTSERAEQVRKFLDYLKK